MEERNNRNERLLVLYVLALRITLAMWGSSIRGIRKPNSFISFISENKRHMPTCKGRVGGLDGRRGGLMRRVDAEGRRVELSLLSPLLLGLRRQTASFSS